MGHWRYFRYVVRHKWFVFLEAVKLGIPWLGVIHDISRFHPSEWFAYAAHQPLGSNRTPEVVNAFVYGWNDHQHRNKHHWEYWVHFDYYNHTMRSLPMPDRYRRELLADWRGASRSSGQPDIVGWYLENRAVMLFHPETRAWLEAQLGVPETNQ